MCFRDWEDSLSDKETYIITIAEQKFLKENKKMNNNAKKIVREAIKSLISLKTKNKKNVVEGGEASDAAPGHYCIHHGGVHHEGKIVAAEAVQHVEPDENGFISHYDMKLPDGTILEDVAAEKIQVTNASLAEGHGNEKGSGKRHDKMKKKKKSEKSEKDDKKDKVAKLKNPKKADLNKDGKLSSYEKRRGQAIEKSMAAEQVNTPEGEESLYEERFTPRNTKLFEKLLKEWTK
jgi:hypothetical protein